MFITPFSSTPLGSYLANQSKTDQWRTSRTTNYVPGLIISDHSTSTTLPWEGSLYQRRPASVTPSEGSSTFGNEIDGFLKSEDHNEIHNSEARISYIRMTDEEKNKNFRDFILWQQLGLDIEKLNCLLINFGVNMKFNYTQLRRVIVIFMYKISL